MKILGIVITYNPDVDLMITNIERYVSYIDDLILWINTPRTPIVDCQESFKGKCYETKIMFKGGNENKGLSFPLNFARKYAIDNNYDYLLTMDQDSYIVNFDYYLNIIKTISIKNGIFCLRINDDAHYDIEYENHFDLINSGSVYSLAALQEVGPFNELFFVDGIDTEYCIRAILRKIPIIMVNNAKIKQTFGSHSVHNFLGKQFLVSNYSERRIYEIIYSNVIMLREFPMKWKFYIFKRLAYLWGVNLLCKIVVYEPDKIKKIMAIIRGYKDGLMVSIPNKY